MMEDDMKRNGSGYIDETPIKFGVLVGPQPGEIWEDTNGNLVLILKNQDGYCNVLAMRKSSHDDNIEICNEMGTFYVNPGMVRFLLNKDKGRYIYTIPLEKHLEIMEAVSERLGVTIKVSRAEEADEVPNDYITENINLCAAVEGLKRKCKDFAIENDALRAELKDNEEMYQKACEMFKEAKAAGESAEKVATNLHTAYVEAEEKAAMWEKMYNALLDRLFARGEAK